jgi:hypothetical protein
MQRFFLEFHVISGLPSYSSNLEYSTSPGTRSILSRDDVIAVIVRWSLTWFRMR